MIPVNFGGGKSAVTGQGDANNYRYDLIESIHEVVKMIQLHVGADLCPPYEWSDVKL